MGVRGATVVHAPVWPLLSDSSAGPWLTLATRAICEVPQEPRALNYLSMAQERAGGLLVRQARASA